MRVIALLIVLCSLLLDVTQSATAYSSSNADNIQTVFVSYDSGDSWSQIGYLNDWTTALDLEIEGITAATKLKYVVSDYGVIGGFIATITYRGEEFVTTDPIGAGYFEISKDSEDSEVDDDDLVYYDASSSPWYILSKNDEMSENAYWIWNSNIDNEITFEFSFEEIGQPVTGAIYDEEADGDTVELTCKHGINSIAAIYGANCRSGSDIGGERQDGPMKNECYGKTDCEFTVSASELGDPCVGTVKDFYYAYTCTGNKYGVNVGSLGTVEASGQSFTISCEGEDMVIKVADAIYGLNCQITARVCGSGSGLAYGTSASPLDVTSYVQDACNGESECTYTVDHTVLGDPCSCVVKDFVYAYQCVPSDMVDDDTLKAKIDYNLMVAKGIEEEGQVNMMMKVFYQESILMKSIIVLVGLLSMYGLYQLFYAAKKKKDSKGEYQSLL